MRIVNNSETTAQKLLRLKIFRWNLKIMIPTIEKFAHKRYESRKSDIENSNSYSWISFPYPPPSCVHAHFSVTRRTPWMKAYLFLPFPSKRVCRASFPLPEDIQTESAQWRKFPTRQYPAELFTNFRRKKNRSALLALVVRTRVFETDARVTCVCEKIEIFTPRSDFGKNGVLVECWVKFAMVKKI